MRTYINAPVAVLDGILTDTTRSRDATGRRAIAAFVGLLPADYFGSVGPSPPSIAALVVVAIAEAAVIFVWAWRFDGHRHVERG